MIQLSEDQAETHPRICIVGVGGAGGNAVASLARSNISGVTLVAANTDVQALSESPAAHIVQLGRRVTEGLGAGSRPELGKAAAEESLAEIEALLDGAHMCFIAAGLGGGTGTGAAPVIAKAARDRGILTVAIVTTPFAFEGTRRARAAQAGLDELRQQVDTLIVIPNQNLFRIVGPSTTFREAFALADEVLHQGVRGITDLIVMPGLINLDFADIRTVMSWMGSAMLGSGQAEGADRALAAAQAAIANPLLDGSLEGAKGLIISITGGEDLRLMEVDEVAGHISALADPEADIIWGSAFDPELDGRIRVSIVATGLEAPAASRAPATMPAAVPAPPMAETRLEPLDEEPGLDAPGSDELLLSMDRLLVLPPAPASAALPDTAATAPAPARAQAPNQGPSLFERMASAARAIGQDARGGGERPYLRRGCDYAAPEIARAA